MGDFTKIPNGTGGLEDRLPMLWTYGVETGRLTPNEFVAVTSTNIAKILNCYPRKGAMLVGADADLVVLDPKKEKMISARTQQSAIDYNVFEGTAVLGAAALRPVARTGDGRRRRRCSRRRATASSSPRPPAGPVSRGALDLEGADRAAPGRAQRHPGERGLSAGRRSGAG